MFRHIRRGCRLAALGLAALLLQAGAALADGVALGGAVDHPRTFLPDDLRRFAPRTVAVRFQTEHGVTQATFTGAPLWALLSAASLSPIPHVKNGRLREIVLATGSDGYRAALSIGELDPRFAGAANPILVAFAQDGKPLAADALRLVVPGDLAGGRYVSHLVSLTVIDPAKEAPP